MPCGLFAQAQALDELGIAVRVLVLEVVQQAAAAADHLEQAAAGVVILGVGLEMAGEIVDAGGQQGDLDFRGSGIGGGALVILEDLGLLGGGRRCASG